MSDLISRPELFKQLKKKNIPFNSDINDIINSQPTKTIKDIIQEVSEDICDNYCKYRDTADDDFICDAIRENGSCPLDRLQ